MNTNEDKTIDTEDSIDEVQTYINDVDSHVTTIIIKSIIDWWKEGELIIPNFQRKFVWKIEQASKFIDSLMSNIPIPSIMLYEDENKRYQIIDGQQRIKSILYFTGNFDKESVDQFDKKYIGFRLRGLSQNSPYYDKTFNGDNEFTEVEKRTLKNKSLPITIIKIKDNNNLMSIYSIFERLNSGGTPLTAQEIRNCICQGKFNDFLFELNKNKKWQTFITSNYDRTHQKDIELILRFFALYDDIESYKRPMKDFLTTYFKKMANASSENIEEKRILFNSVVNAISDNIGEKPFHGKNGLNSSFADSIMLSFAHNIDNIPSDIKSRWFKLINNDEFYSCIDKSSDSAKDINKRIEFATEKLFKEVGEQEYKTIKLFDIPASAGTGNWLGDDNISYQEIPTSNRRADFALKISGDSMSPKINDGDIVLVKRQSTIKPGEIGAFTYKNRAYVKKFIKASGIEFLYSLNKKHSATKIENKDRFYVNGLVVDILPKGSFTL